MSIENERVNDPQLAEAMARESDETHSRAVAYRADAKTAKNEKIREILNAFAEANENNALRLEEIGKYKHEVEQQAEGLPKDELEALIVMVQENLDATKSEHKKILLDSLGPVDNGGEDKLTKQLELTAGRLIMERGRLEALQSVYSRRFGEIK